MATVTFTVTVTDTETNKVGTATSTFEVAAPTTLRSLLKSITRKRLYEGN